MFGDPDADSSVTIRLQLFTHDGSLYRCDHAVNGSIQQPHDKTDGRGKLHAPRQTQKEAGSTDVV
jgi:hypothetical protein